MLRKALMLAVCGALAVGVASANVPDPNLSTVPECLIITPGNLGSLDDYNVTIAGSGGTITGALVEVRFNAVGDTLTCWCNSNAGPRPYTFSSSTNGSGVATFQIRGGGCIEKGLAAIPGNSDFAGEIYADGVKMQEFGTVSSDAVDNSGDRPTDTGNVWDPAGSCASGLADAVEHGTPLGSSAYDWCTDINCDGAVGLADGGYVTSALSQATACTELP
jgi:hypothetical protein